MCRYAYVCDECLYILPELCAGSYVMNVCVPELCAGFVVNLPELCAGLYV